MDKRIWVNIGLVFFIILLSAVLLLTEDEAEPTLPQIADIDPKDINKIEVLRKDRENLIFHKQGAIWQMRSPHQFRVNNARINAMLRLLKSESHGQLNPTAVDLARFNLADPSITIKFNDYVFQFGNTDAIDQRRYVMFADVIYLTNDFLYKQLTTNAAFFADPKILPVDFAISAIQFPEHKIELLNGQWQSQTGLDISPDQLQRIAYNWNNAMAISVSAYATPAVESSIIVSSTNGDNIAFMIVSKEPHLILGRKALGIQYHLGSDEPDKLLLKEQAATRVLPASS